MIHKDLPHQPCGNSVKVRPALPIRAGLINESQISLVDKLGRLQHVAWAFPPQVAGRQLSKPGVDEWRELLKGFCVALCPFGQQKRHFIGKLRGELCQRLKSLSMKGLHEGIAILSRKVTQRPSQDTGS